MTPRPMAWIRRARRARRSARWSADGFIAPPLTRAAGHGTGRPPTGAAGEPASGASAVAAPESLERLCGLARPLVRPPVTAAVEEHELAAHASGQALGEAWGDVGVVAAPKDQGGPRDAGDAVLPLLADAYRRAVETQ